MRTGKYLKITDVYEEVLRDDRPPRFVNDFPLHSKEDKDILKSNLVTIYDGTDALMNVPSCHCGLVTEKSELGTYCMVCNTEVEAPMNRKIKTDLWIRSPEGVNKLITPLGWYMLSKGNVHKGFNVLEYICDPSVREPSHIKQAMKKISIFKKEGLSRGLNEFIDNYEIYVDFLHSISDKKENKDDFREFALRYKDKILVDVLPLPSKVVFAVEHTPVGSYYDSTADYCVEAAHAAATLKDIPSGERNSELIKKKIVHRIIGIISSMSEFYHELLHKSLCPKSGWFRSVCYGHRMNFCFRNIITSEHQPHMYNEIRAPYKLVLKMLKPVVLRRLQTQHEMTYCEAVGFIERNSATPHDTIWGILEDLIDETPPRETMYAVDPFPDYHHNFKTKNKRVGRGLGCTLTRYPSLDRLSTQFFYIVGLTNDHTTISLLCTKGPNADFDGDNMTGVLTLVESIEREMKMLSPEYGIHSDTKIMEFKKVVGLPDTIIGMKLSKMDAEEWEI